MKLSRYIAIVCLACVATTSHAQGVRNARWETNDPNHQGCNDEQIHSWDAETYGPCRDPSWSDVIQNHEYAIQVGGGPDIAQYQQAAQGMGSSIVPELVPFLPVMAVLVAIVAGPSVFRRVLMLATLH